MVPISSHKCSPYVDMVYQGVALGAKVREFGQILWLDNKTTPNSTTVYKFTCYITQYPTPQTLRYISLYLFQEFIIPIIIILFRTCQNDKG